MHRKREAQSALASPRPRLPLLPVREKRAGEMRGDLPEPTTTGFIFQMGTTVSR